MSGDITDRRWRLPDCLRSVFGKRIGREKVARLGAPQPQFRGTAVSLINYLTRIEFGEGEVARLPEFLAALGVRHPLIATDKGLVSSGLVDRVRELVGDGAVVFDGTPANPTEEAVNVAYALYRASGCDGIVGLGVDRLLTWRRRCGC